MKKALIFQGGWDGHEPQLTSKRFAEMLERNGISAEIYDKASFDCSLWRIAECFEFTFDVFDKVTSVS